MALVVRSDASLTNVTNRPSALTAGVSENVLELIVPLRLALTKDLVPFCASHR